MTEPPGLAPFLSIWFSPRATTRRIVATDPRRYTWLLMTLATFFALLDTFATRIPFDPPKTIASYLGVGLSGVLVVSSLLAPLGIPSLPPVAIVYRWVAGWFRGAGSRDAIAAVIAWSVWPLVAWWMVSWAIRLATSGAAAFGDPGSLAPVALVVGFGHIVALVFALVIAVAGVAEVCGVSTMESIAINVIATLIVVVPLLIIVLIATTVLVLVLLSNM